MIYDKKLVLQDGSVFKGYGFGSDKKIISELVFNTSMVGYPEILSDNSYCGQMICFTYPMIGNYGVCLNDLEGQHPACNGLIVREYCEYPQNNNMDESLDEYLKKYEISGISGIDTRMLTRQIRDNGTQLACICNLEEQDCDIINELNSFKPRTDEVAQVSTKRIYQTKTQGYKVVVVDCGVKLNIVNELEKRGLNVTVVPYDITYEEVKKFNPDGIVLSNGPGNPKCAVEVIELTIKIQSEVVVFGICLGHQVIALANGCEIEKLKFGHRGANHPVKNLVDDKIEITSQNHSYAVVNNSIDQSDLEVTHINLLDNSIEGLRHKKYDVYSVQYHPESAPGPSDSNYLFDNFYDLLKKSKGEF
ncbi:MAG: carbamoyl phosphate synthase small subunit [Mycoplasmatales bacterium]